MHNYEREIFEEARLVYDRHGIRVEDSRKKEVHIFGSSSKGNSVYVPAIRTLIDLGLPMKKYKTVNDKFFFQVDFILLTHEHGDHINISTFLKILNDYPNVQFIIHPNMWKALIGPALSKRVKPQQLEKILEFNGGDTQLLPYKDPNRRFIAADQAQLLSTRENIPFSYKSYLVQHGPITNVAIELYFNKLRLLYSSDLDSVKPKDTVNGSTEGLPDNKKFDIICLEANYDEDFLAQFLAENPGDIHAINNQRHISEQESKWYTQYHLKNNGIYIPLHASSTFGTYLQ